MVLERGPRLGIWLGAALALASCKGAECVPTDPVCNPPVTPTVANIAVTSPIDTVMAVGRTAQLSAAATSSTGAPVSATFAWTSSVAATATVDASSGLVTAAAAGSTDIRATVGTVSGLLRMRAVNADLPGVGTTVTDPFVQSMRGALTATPASTLNTFLTTCEGHRSTGHVRALDTCLSSALGVTSTDAADGALLGVLDLFFDHARRQLQIN